MIPIGVCNAIEKSVWGSTRGTCKVPLGSWDACCQLLSNGGLSLRKLGDQNKAFLLKLGFHLITKIDALPVGAVLCLSLHPAVPLFGDLCPSFGMFYEKAYIGLLEMVDQ